MLLSIVRVLCDWAGRVCTGCGIFVLHVVCVVGGSTSYFGAFVSFVVFVVVVVFWCMILVCGGRQSDVGSQNGSVTSDRSVVWIKSWFSFSIGWPMWDGSD